MIRFRFWRGLLLLPALAQAASVQSLETIRQAVVTQLASIIRRSHHDYDIRMAPLDPRLRLPECDLPLQVALQQERWKAGWNAVRVRCEGTHPWTIYVKVRVGVYRDVVVLTRDLPKGMRLSASHLALQRRDVAALRQGYLTSTASVLGQRLRRSLPAGYVLHPGVLMADKVVQRGEAVIIRARRGGLDVRMGGHALMDGSVGQRIRVRNDHSGRVIEGIVRNGGEVWVIF